MVKLGQGLKSISNLSKKTWLIILVATLSISVISLAAYFRTVTKQLSYQLCEINYGEPIGSYDGNSDTEWNQTGYHYEVKRYSLLSNAPKQFFPNVREKAPTVLIGSSPQTDLTGCRAEFTGLIEPGVDRYKWQGAIATGVRLGFPNINQQFTVVDKLKPDPSLKAPATSSGGVAAVWVDDAAAASIQTADKSVTKEIWCQPLPTQKDCQFRSGQSLKIPRSEGYLFTEDNCPVKDCEELTDWYKQSGKLVSYDLASLMTRNDHQELAPFYLHLSAISTHGYKVGTWLVMTHKYPLTSTLYTQLKATPQSIEPGQAITFNLALDKSGPNIKDLIIKPKITGLPMSISQNFVADQSIIEQLNTKKTVSISAKFQVDANAAVDTCFTLEVPIEFNNVIEQPSSAVASAPFCVSKPKAVYTYNVTSRGVILADLNEFINLSTETLTDTNGWAAAGIVLQRVSSSGNFTVVLISPSELEKVPGCDGYYSCNSGRYVYINDERWRNATPAWNLAGGSLRDYRHMVINHETGHWLGFGHYNCPGVGQTAPVMQQQSISLQGCTFNPWPTAAEVNILKART